MLKKVLIRVIVFILVFAAGVAVFSRLRNREGMIEAAEMKAASLPVMYMQEGETLINPMYGHRRQMDGVSVRDHLTLLPTGRDLKLALDAKGQDISSVIYTVKSVDGAEIVENSKNPQFSAG